ncbi:MAG: PEGA domain-containing protein [Ignavibacteriae bacterium]|nr:PEGA domain-containing protein [Ignavibacteriota bacterium]
MKLSLFSSIAICLWMAIGCGTIIHGTMQDITINSTPANAALWVDGVEMGKTPATVNLRRKDEHQIRVVKEGYRDLEVKVESNTNGALFGNILFGGLIGCIVDLSNGAAYSLSPDEITINLAQADSISGTTIRVAPDDLQRIHRVRFTDETGETAFLLTVNWEEE